MKTNLWRTGLAIAMAALLFGACKKDNNSANGSSSGSAKMSFGLQADNASAVLANNETSEALVTQASSGAGSVTWTSGTANISGFNFEAKRRGLEVEIRSRSMASIDIFAPVPTMVSSVIDTGLYREIEIRVMLSKTSGSTIPLTLKGTFTTSGGAAVPIELDFNDDATIKAEADNVTVDNTTDITTIVSMHLNKLLDHVSASGLEAATRTSGTIVISSSSNTSIYNKIRDNIGNCGGFRGFNHRDRD
ncbi:hypothetical protein HQ865_04495 [Mucilaginibacter mali]|uniref:DUF4382 domain-containing protein n=1 Tax=Mucilaginibacter mali TaxID=2740462 RepID=A0A7D4UNJ7_9SPHI|nr:hypothetical protein [Mucilaginibacter mali]QKJ29040.1 hypothetical protein HQ865_04495 [Mucilaginibacter mali]